MAMTDASLAAMSAHGAVVVVAEHLVKRYPSGVLAADDVSLAIPRGAIHAIVGAPGSGLSTLMQLLSGIEAPTSGRLAIDGQICVCRDSRSDATFAGVGLVPQRSKLLPALTVAQNVVLGAEPIHGSFLGVRRGRESVLDMGRTHDLHIDPDLRIVSLSSGQKQIVEILKALHRGVRVLLLDEPMALLKPHEAKALLGSLKSLAAGGVTVVVACHRPSEAWRIAESFTVIRGGRVVARRRTIDVSEAQLTSMVNGDAPQDPGSDSIRSCRLNVVDLVLRDSVGKVLLDRVSFQIGAGEILGLAAFPGHGQDVLVDVLSGLTSVGAGSVTVNGKLLSSGPEMSTRLGIVRLPAERASGDPIQARAKHDDTTSFEAFEPQVGRRGWLDARVAAPRAREIIRRQRSRSKALAEADRPSGGIQQSGGDSPARPQVVIATLPSRDDDTAACQALRDDLLAWRAAGVAVLMISSDVDALIDMSDRIAVMFEGRLVSNTASSSATPARIRTCMAGLDPHEEVASSS